MKTRYPDFPRSLIYIYIPNLLLLDQYRLYSPAHENICHFRDEVTLHRVSNLGRGTIPSLPQGDLTEEADSNLYVNPLEVTEKVGTGRVKKSISGEVGRNIITDTSPSIESLKEIRPSNEASKVNLNDIIPKHRKIRIQQVSSLSLLKLFIKFALN